MDAIVLFDDGFNRHRICVNYRLKPVCLALALELDQLAGSSRRFWER